MNEQIQFARRPGWGPKDYLRECRRLLGIEERAACYSDTDMDTSERRVILLAAILPT